MGIETKKDKTLLFILREFNLDQTITNLSKEMNISRVGMWKIIKKLQEEELIIIKSIGKGKTSTHLIKLNWDNLLLEKSLTLIIAQESNKEKRWSWEFNQLKKHVDFTILYGSILHSPEKANDIDIINVVSKKSEFVKIDKLIMEKQAAQSKKIHDINFTPKEFKTELKKQNKAFLHAIKTGIILYNQENFVTFMKEILT